MPATTISNPRDLVAQLLGELLFVERRLAGGVLESLMRTAGDAELHELLGDHLAVTREHVERAETAFRKLGLAPTANLSRPFESAVSQHETLAPSIVEPRLADLFHAQAALQTEHWELAAYRTLLPLVDGEIRPVLKQTLDEEGDTAKQLVAIIDRLGDAG
jgi:ferritin-like metal-binding protein YciE